MKRPVKTIKEHSTKIQKNTNKNDTYKNRKAKILRKIYYNKNDER
jgi:hypothetical protein